MTIETDTGNEYVSEMTGFVGNPMGTINRNDGGSGTPYGIGSEWVNGVNNEINKPLIANIQLKNYYFTQTMDYLFIQKLQFLSPHFR